MDEARREYEVGSAHDSAGREAEAIPHYERALELGLPDEVVPGALLQLGSSLAARDKIDDAVALLDSAVDRFPDHAALRLFRALALASAGAATGKRSPTRSTSRGRASTRPTSGDIHARSRRTRRSFAKSRRPRSSRSSASPTPGAPPPGTSGSGSASTSSTGSSRGFRLSSR